MIPTSFASSSPPTTAASGGSGFLSSTNNSPLSGSNSSTNSNNNSSSSSINNSALLGIASLILEGRALAEDEYAIVAKHQEVTALTYAANAMDCGRQSPKPSTSRAAAFYDHHHHYAGLGAGAGSVGMSSTASSATNTGGNLTSDIASYLRRKASNSPESAHSSSSLLRDYYSNSSSESAASSVDSNHSRWTQKLSQLRQESPSAQHHHLAAAREQKIAVECVRSSEPEYVALAINTDPNNDEHRRGGGGDFEIIRRIALNRINLYNTTPSSTSVSAVGSVSGVGSSDNFMCSLQTLASSTCLRVGTPILSNPMVSSSTPKYSTYRVSPPTPRFPTPQHTDVSAGSASSCGSVSGGHSPRNSTISWHPSTATPAASTNRDNLLCKASTARISIPTPQNTPPPTNNSSTTSSSNSANAHQLLTKRLFLKECSSAAVSSSTPTTSRNKATSATTTTTTTTTTSPQQGPHCDQFLRKMGLAKGDASETEEHHCDMSYVNITCTRWRAYCIKMEYIIARGEPLCIEVYLGPVGHKILLEQWIITVKEKQPPPTMTLPSLCSAIRSQLYFSQISAWCDLIKKSDKTIYDTGRLILSTSTTTSAAGDLATTTATTLLSTSPSTGAAGLALPSPSSLVSSPNAGSPSPVGCNMHGTSGIVGCTKRRPPRLNIFYRIKPHDDNTTPACFNTKPNVHNFPNVNVSENCCVSVCLKSLPRITGGIPKVGTTTAPAVASESTTTTIATTTTAAAAVATAAITPNISPVTTTTTTTTTNRPSTPTMISTSKATTSKSLGANVFKTKPAAAIIGPAAPIIANKPTTTTTILTINCDNKTSKEHHPQQKQPQQQQQQTKTAVFNVFHEMMNHRNHHHHLCQERDKDAYANDDDGGVNDDDHDFDGECDRKMCAATCCSSGVCGGVSVESVDGGDGDSSNSSFSTNYGNISHREKQLLKYRKRMLKRDKKQRKTVNNECASGQLISEVALKMEQGDDDDGDIDADDDDRQPGRASANHVQNTTKGQRQQQQLPKSFINNSIPFTNLGQQSSRQQSEESQQQHHVKMISTGTQTTTNTCASCGFEKSMICLKCNPLRNPAVDAGLGPKTTVNMNQFNCFDNDENMDAETASISSTSSASAGSLSSSEIIHTPRNKAELLLQAIQRTPKANKKHKKVKDLKQHLTNIKQSVSVSSSPPLTPPPTSSQPQQQQQSSNNNNRLAGSNSSRSSSSSSHTNIISSATLNGTMQTQGCQVCKRQKTQHHFQTNTQELDDDACVEDKSSAIVQIDKSTSHSDLLQNQTNGTKTDNVVTDLENETDAGKMPAAGGDCVDKNAQGKNVGEALDLKLSPSDGYNNQEIMEEEYFTSSTKLTPYIERCSLASKMYYRNQLHHQPSNYSVDARLLCSTPPLIEQQNNDGGGNNKGLLLAQFKTPTPAEQQQNKSGLNRQLLQQPHKHTPKPNLLQIACNFNGSQVPTNTAQDINQQQSKDVIPSIHNPILLRRNSPKVNLTPIFCNPSSMMGASSNPIPIGNSMSSSTSFLGSKSAEIQITHASPTFSFESHGGTPPPPTITVQKSNSAPTLPNSPSLSPRFVKASALYKRRSRHLSDRSDRSSLGSDEQFSDEDIDSGMYSPFATSPVKSRTRLSAVFGRKPFLGNLEESLLQRRLVPKIEVMGFKLLLGASGGFCPTQLTIPAAAYFYELKGETLSTPYLCEIRLPRKGYNVPRSGTVQATLLNPMGTVVRMFVIPYDMRDMPALHQTFIRQRILADTGDAANGSRSATKQTTSPGVASRAAIGDSGGVEDNNGDAIMQNGNMMNLGAGDDFATIKTEQRQHQQCSVKNSNNNNNNHNVEDHLGHFISAENMKSLRYSIHLRFQTSRSGRLMLHSDIRLLISRRTDCDTAAAHAKGLLEAPNELITNTVMPTNPKYSARQEQTAGSKI